jgi:MFS family permease
MKLAPCPDCGNACSLTAPSCPRCGRIMQPGDLSENNLVKTTDYSKLKNILVPLLAFVTGATAFLIYFSVIPYIKTRESDVNQILAIIASSIFIISLFALAALFGFVWDKFGWRLGLWLVSLPLILMALGLLTSLASGSFLSFFVILAFCGFMVLAGCFGVVLGAKYKKRLQSK